MYCFTFQWYDSLLYRDESKEAKLRAAESHLKLGEVSLETGMLLQCFVENES